MRSIYKFSLILIFLTSALLLSNESVFSWKLRKNKSIFYDADCYEIARESDDEFEKALERAGKWQEKDLIQGTWELARLYHCHGDAKTAEGYYDDAIMYSSGNNLEILFDKARLYEENFRFEDAIKIDSQIIKKNDYFLKAVYQMGSDYVALGKFENAIEYLNKYRTHDKFWPGTYTALASAYFGLNNDDKALEYLKQVDQVDPNWEITPMKYFWYYLYRGDMEQSYRQIEKLSSMQEYYSADTPYKL